jgi:hypothetical protein
MRITTKDAGLRLRLERELRDEFVESCRAAGKPAAQVLREFMREYVGRARTRADGPKNESVGDAPQKQNTPGAC